MAAKSLAKKGVAAMRRFDLRDELRETADRRKRPSQQSSSASAPGHGVGNLRHEGIAGIAARLAAMFPGLPQDTIEGALSELFRQDPRCSRDQLADRAVAVLVEMSREEGVPQSLTSFEARSFESEAVVDLTPDDPEEVVDLTPSAPPADEAAAASGSAAVPSASAKEELLDSNLAELLGLPTKSLRPCVDTLVSIMRRIAENPGDQKVRRLKRANPAFEARVGCHPVAIELMKMAGFQEGLELGEAVIAFHGDPATSEDFQSLYESLGGVAEVLREEMPEAPSASAGAPAPKSARSTSSGVRSGAGARSGHRQHIAELTEQRLRDPRGFREAATSRKAANRIVGQLRTAPAAASAQPQRRAQHFNLSDIERMRIQGEIDNMPSYAQEYQQQAQAGPARSYGELVARGYDPELVARQALDGTNRYRASKGLAPLRWHDGIAKIARQHAEQMATGAMPFSHDGFDQRVNAYPVAYRSAAENLALNSGVADVAGCAVDGWIKSPGHEKNLSGAFNLCGIGVARSSNGTFYLTQLFANAL